jgi:hypothetical protein
VVFGVIFVLKVRELESIPARVDVHHIVAIPPYSWEYGRI